MDSPLNRLRDFLAHYSTNTGEETNLTNLEGKWGGKWLIPNNKYEEFLTLYFHAAKDNNVKFVEKKRNTDEVFYLFADIDISQEEINQFFGDSTNHKKAHKLPDDMLNSILDTYQKIINETFVFDDEELTLHLNIPVISCRLKSTNKFHLNWPGLVVNNTIGKYVRQLVIAQMKSQINGNWDKWIDAASYTCTGLRMLGSLKPHERKDNRYYVVMGFQSNNELLNGPNDINYALIEDDVINTSIRVIDDIHELHALNPLVQQNNPDVINTLASHKLQLQSQSGGQIVKVNLHVAHKPKTAKPAPKKYSDEVLKVFADELQKGSYGNLKITDISLKEVLMVANNGYSARIVEKIHCPIKGGPHKRKTGCNYLHMCAKGSQLRCSDEECAKCRGFPKDPIPLPPDAARILYNININSVVNATNSNNTNNGVINNITTVTPTIESLAQLDFINDCDIIMVYEEREKNQVLLKALNGGERCLAALLFQHASDRFYFGKAHGWWYWDGIRWKKDPHCCELVDVIADLIPLIEKARELYKSNLHDVEKLFKIDSVLKRLDTSDYIAKIIKFAEWIFGKSTIFGDLINRLDTNSYLIGFPNGVYDLEKMVFRKTECKDFISVIMNYDYKSDVDQTAMSAVESFLESIMPDNDDRHYLLKLLSSGLLGQNPDELFHIFTGSGRNGKSKLAELIKLTLGEYYESISSSFLSSKITSPEQATPHLVKLKQKRLSSVLNRIRILN